MNRAQLHLREGSNAPEVAIVEDRSVGYCFRRNGITSLIAVVGGDFHSPSNPAVQILGSRSRRAIPGKAGVAQIPSEVGIAAGNFPGRTHRLLSPCRKGKHENCRYDPEYLLHFLVSSRVVLKLPA